MRFKFHMLVGLLVPLSLSSCSQPRQPMKAEFVAHPSIARYVGKDLAPEVPSSLVSIAIEALDLLHSEQALSYTRWPEALRGYPPRGPFKEFSVDRLGHIGQTNIVHVFLLESDPKNGRSFSVYWDTEKGECESIMIAMP